MFVHELPSSKKVRDDSINAGYVDVSTKLQKVFIECDWYRQVGVDRFTGLRIIEYEPNWEGSKIVLLERCLPKNINFWPCNPFAPYNRKVKAFDLKIQPLNVIFYHETAA